MAGNATESDKIETNVKLDGKIMAADARCGRSRRGRDAGQLEHCTKRQRSDHLYSGEHSYCNVSTRLRRL